MKSASLVFLLAFFNLFVWHSVFSLKQGLKPAIYFLDVGQGDSELAVLAGGAKILIDGGGGKSVLYALEKALNANDKYIDLMVLSHPNIDHFGGLIDVLRHYKVGAFMYNGDKNQSPAYEELENELKISKTRVIEVGQGDKIKYRDNSFYVFHPRKNRGADSEVNENSLVMMLDIQGTKSFFTGDTSLKILEKLGKEYNLRADILKIPHHGSKYSFDEKLLGQIEPRVAVIEVGKNSYGHPASQVLEVFQTIRDRLYRTDQDGSLKVSLDNGKVTIFKIR